MTQAQLKAIGDWIGQTLAAHPHAQSVLSLNFPRLPLYFSRHLLAQTKVVFVEKCPVPPLSDLGLNQFADFEKEVLRGITYPRTYFILHQESQDEALHFHELVHVVQWQCLGFERFIAEYEDGLIKHRVYRERPLEAMAYAHQAKFESDAPPYVVEMEVSQQLRAMTRPAQS